MIKDEGAGRQSMYKAKGAGRQGTHKAKGAGRRNMYQAETKRGDFYQYKDNRNVSPTAKLRKAGEEVITERHLQHKVKDKGKEEATGDVNRYKRPVLRDKEGKKEMEVKKLKYEDGIKYLQGKPTPSDDTTRHTTHIEDCTEEEKERKKEDEGRDIQERRVISKDQAPALTKEELREEAEQDKIYQKLKAAKKDRNVRQAQVAQIKEHNKNNGEVKGLFEGDEHTIHKTQCKEGPRCRTTGSTPTRSRQS